MILTYILTIQCKSFDYTDLIIDLIIEERHSMLINKLCLGNIKIFVSLLFDYGLKENQRLLL